MSWVGKLNTILLFFFPPPSLGSLEVPAMATFCCSHLRVGPWVVGPAQYPWEWWNARLLTWQMGPWGITG